MNQFLVDKNNYHSEITLEKILEYLLKQHRHKKLTATEVITDGFAHNISKNPHILQKKAKDFKSIEFYFRNDIDLAFESLDKCNHYIDIIIEQVQELITLYKKNNFVLANRTFVEVIDILDLYIQFFSKIHKIIKSTYPSQTKNVNSVQDFESDLLTTLRNILLAKEKEDIVMLGDLLAHDLMETLNQWKIQVIPALKRLQST